MAKRAGPLTLGAVALSGGIAVLVLGTALVLAAQAQGFSLRPADWDALIFTLKQAGLSALCATVLAVPTARALARRRFVGRGAMVALMGAPFLLPVVVAVVGMLAVYGRNGVFNQALQALGLPPVPIFGLQGVVMTNVFFDLPLATRILLNGWAAIPAERFRLAETLGLPPQSQFRHIEAPMLRSRLPGTFSTVFLLCLTSFVVSLSLGGGPAATTLELAIYQALRFDFDLGRAALLAGMQLATCAIAVAMAGRMTMAAGLGSGLDRMSEVPAPGGWRRGVDGLVLAGVAVFLCLPLGAVVQAGLGGLADLPAAVWQAAGRSLVMAILSAAIALMAGLCLALAASRGIGPRWIGLVAMLPMAASGLVLGTGLFVVLRPITTPEAAALPVTVLVNAVMALPFIYRLVLPQAEELEQGYARLCATLGLTGWARLRFVTLPRLACPWAWAAA